MPLRAKMTKIALCVECKIYGCYMYTCCIHMIFCLGCIWVGNYGTEEVYEDRMVA